MFAARNALLAGVKPKVPVVFKGATGAVSTQLTLPSHTAGDIIVIAAFNEADLVVSKPSAGGNVPSWVDITVTNRIRTAYCVATSSSTTSGTWSSAQQIMAAVLSGQGSSPIGGSGNQISSTSSSAVTAPAVTMQATDQTSQLLHFGFHEANNRTNTAFSTSGYTARLDPASADAYRLVTKNDTSSDGSVVVITASGVTRWGAATIEIVA